MHSNLCKGLFALVMIGAAPSAFANVITDWDEKGIAAVTGMASLGGTSPYMAQRMMGMVHAAMFDAVNSIERRYRPYLVQLAARAGRRRGGALRSTKKSAVADDNWRWIPWLVKFAQPPELSRKGLNMG